LDDRPSAWLAGAGLGLCLGSGVLLAAYASHVALGWGAIGVFLGLFGFGLGLMPFAEFLARGLWAAVTTVAEAWNSWGTPGVPGNQEIPPQIATQDDEPENYTAEIDRLTRARAHRRAHWDVFWRRLVQAGDAYGWTQAKLTTDGTPTKVMSEPAWNYTIPMLVESGWLSGGKVGKPTRWAPGRSLVDFDAEQAWHALPHPDSEPPEIALPPYTTPRHNTTTATTTVIEGIARPPNR
jgi:hypothetical protein